MHGDSNMFCRAGEDILALTAGIGLGAGLMYLYDPNRGRGRRIRLKDEATALLHCGERALEHRGKDLLNRAQGLAVRVAEEILPEEPPSDPVLLERIRSRMGHIVSHPHQVEVRVENGEVTLEGRMPYLERRRLKHELRGMPAVKRLKDHLDGWPVLNTALLIGIGAGLAAITKTNAAK